MGGYHFVGAVHRGRPVIFIYRTKGWLSVHRIIFVGAVLRGRPVFFIYRTKGWLSVHRIYFCKGGPPWPPLSIGFPC